MDFDSTEPAGTPDEVGPPPAPAPDPGNPFEVSREASNGPERPDPGGDNAINAVAAAITSTYLVTHSAFMSAMAGSAALLLALLGALRR